MGMANFKEMSRLSEQMSQLFDGQEMEIIAPILVTALAFIIVQCGDNKEERLRLHESVTQDILDEVIKQSKEKIQ